MPRTPSPSPGARDTAGAALMLLLLIAACLAISGGAALFTKQAWLDEYHSLLTAGTGGWRDGLAALSAGADFNPPLLPILYRTVGALTGGIDVSGRATVSLRLFTFVLVWAGMVLLYRLLRRRFAPQPAFIAAFATWSHPLVVRHSVELRFYGPWLVFTLAFIAALTSKLTSKFTSDSSSRIVRSTVIAMAAVAVCTIHYFGALTWGVVVVAVAWSGRATPRRELLLRIAPALVGPIALAACIPMYLGQRRSLSAATWIDPPSLASAADFVSSLVIFTLGASAIVWALMRVGLIPRSGDVAASEQDGWWNEPALAALAALGVIPLVLIAFSYLVQPSIQDRYAITAVASVAPVLAAVLTRACTRTRATVLIVFLSVATFAGQARLAEDARIARSLDEIRESLSSDGDPQRLVLAATRSTLYPLAALVPSGASAALAYPVLPDSVRSRATTYELVEQDVARTHSRLYGFPRLVPLAELRALPSLRVVSLDDPGDFVRRWLPGHTALRLSPHVLDVRLTEP